MASKLLFLLQKPQTVGVAQADGPNFCFAWAKKKKKKEQTTHQCKEKEEMRRGGQASGRSKPPSWSKDPASPKRSHFNEAGFLSGYMEEWITYLALTTSTSLCFEHVSSRKRWATARPKWSQLLLLRSRTNIHSLHFHILAHDYRPKA